ncbi:MAG: hypothetical protein A2Z03_07885 [Chloroflexi bacterium RBG_16_56_8]|nr:MAG: hypothetical protein A2Z03_07885 [Chloroflexi bacterium RBG_16_56_8]
MFPRFRIALVLSLLLALTLSVPTLAGGWAVIVLDKLPVKATAGEPLTVGFMVLQHGRTPMTGLTPIVSGTLSGRKETLSVAAKAKGKAGHYEAVLTFPQAGDWNWSIQAFTMDVSMPTLTVSIPVGLSPAQAEQQMASSFPPSLLVSALGFAGGLIGLVLAFRRRPQWAVALTVVGLAVGVTSLAAATAPTAAASKGSSLDAAKSVSLSSASQIELGRKLFTAKGCVTCHVNNKAAAPSFSVEAGPNLSNYKASPEYLRMWLKDPVSVKPLTQMPNLGLSEAEMEALIAFINSD